MQFGAASYTVGRLWLYGCHDGFPDNLHSERQKHFTSEGLARDIRSNFCTAVIAVCNSRAFLPSIHILAEGKAESARVREYCEAEIRVVARRWIAAGVAGRLFDRVLREDDSARRGADTQNPVHPGGPVPVEYPFCGSSIWSKEELVESTMWRPGAP